MEVLYCAFDANYHSFGLDASLLIAAGVIPDDMDYTLEADASHDDSDDNWGGPRGTWSNEFSVADLLRYHEPYNMDVLLRHLKEYESGE